MGIHSRDPKDLAAKSHHWSNEMKFATEEITIFTAMTWFFFSSFTFSSKDNVFFLDKKL